MTSSEELCLQWNDFENIVRSAFADLRNDEDLTDVTLAFAEADKSSQTGAGSNEPVLLGPSQEKQTSAPPNSHERHQIGKHVGYD